MSARVLRSLALGCALIATVAVGCKLRPQTAGSESIARDVAPGFALSDELGNQVSLALLTTTGPVVLVFYRGHW